MYIHASCGFCSKPVVRKKQAASANVKVHFCNNGCKSEYQRLAKPVTKEWLYHQYVTLGRDTTQIGHEVGRDPKSVWNWLKDFGIPTRPRGSYSQWRPRGRKPGFKHSPEFRKRLSEIAKSDGRVPYDPKIGSYMKGRKGANTPNWKGGVTPERQALYSSEEWIKAAREVWKRDKRTCQRCGKVKSKGHSFDIHHIVSFECKELRAVVSNLVLLCEPCHYWVHSKKNKKGEFLKCL